MARPPYADAVDARRSTGAERTRRRPLDAPFEEVVGNVEVGLRTARSRAHEAVIGVAGMNAPIYVSARGIETAERARRVLDRDPLHVDVAAVHLQHVAARAVLAIENRAVVVDPRIATVGVGAT